jgi:NADH dehydrogenase FAD-containing subunit
MSSQPHDIVILGNSFAGLRIAHVLLGDVIPNLPTPVSGPKRKFRVVFVAPSDRFYMNISSLRALARPPLVDDERLQPEFLPHFEKYRATAPVEFIQGYATQLDAERRIVTVKRTGDYAAASDEIVEVSYDSLIIATGTSTSTAAIKSWSTGTAASIRKELHELAAEIKAASTIAIGGGGTTAVELSSELREAYPEKRVTVYAGKSGIVSAFPEPQRRTVAERLTRQFGVTIVNQRVTRAERNPKTGLYEISLAAAEGEASAAVVPEPVDLYISAVGQTPNTSFLPAAVLDERGYVLSDAHLRVTGLAPRVYVTGDASALSIGNLDSVRTHTGALKETLKLELALVTEDASSSFSAVADESAFLYVAPTPKLPLQDFAVTLGSTGGVGLFNGHRIPSCILRLVKARDASISGALIMVGGSPFSLKLLVGQVKKGQA